MRVFYHIRVGITSGRQLFGEVRLDRTSLQDELVKLCDDYVIIPYMEKREKYIDVYVWERAGAASHAVAAHFHGFNQASADFNPP